MTKTTWNPFMGFGSAPEKNVRKLEQERDEARAQVADLLAACKAALNDINTARRHAYNWQPGRHLDHIEHTLEPTTRLLDAAIAAAEGRAE